MKEDAICNTRNDDNIKIDHKELRSEGNDWIYLAWVMHQTQAPIITVMTFEFFKILGICLLVQQLLASQEGLCCVGLGKLCESYMEDYEVTHQRYSAVENSSVLL
jgi:hypothetical protein